MTDDTPRTNERTDTAESTNATDTPERHVVDALEDYTVALETVDPTAELDALDPIGERLGEAAIIGLGEATHGTREFFRLKHRLLRYLVLERGVRVFGLEANFPETQALDDYVVYGDGDPIDALERTRFWTWRVESILDMVKWLRAYNADRPVEDRVRFYGFDAQFTQGAVEGLVEFFERVDAPFLRTVREDLETIGDGGTSPHRDDRLEARFTAADGVVPELRDRLRVHREAYVSEASESAWELACQHVTVIEQACELKRATYERRDGDTVTEADAARTLRVRDRAMADNVDWIREHEGADRMVLWAHDGHVNRRENVSRRTGAAATSMGGHLADRHGQEYYALGFAFGRGSFQAIGPDPDAEDDERTRSLREQTVDAPPTDTFEETVSELDRSLAVVDIGAASEDDRVADWLATPRRHLSVGAMFDPDDPEAYVTERVYAATFDGVCYVDETTRARPVERDPSGQ